VECKDSGDGHHVTVQILEPDDGPSRRYPVFCVHALARNSTDFENLSKSLVESGYRVGLLDVVGRGMSDRAENASDYNYGIYGTDAEAVLAHLGWTDVHWVGTSMGGLLGMMLAAKPDGAASFRTHALVLNDIGPWVPQEPLDRIATYMGKEHIFTSIEDAEAYFRSTYAGFDWKSDALWRRMVEKSTVPTDEGGLRMHYDHRIGEAFTTPMAPVNLWVVWGMVRCSSLLVLRGETSDILLPTTAVAMVDGELPAEAPEAEVGLPAQRASVATGYRRLETIAGAGHAPALWEDGQIEMVSSAIAAAEAEEE
jgi:pimeloyl-ACP methyl ester carboxylesterase